MRLYLLGNLMTCAGGCLPRRYRRHGHGPALKSGVGSRASRPLGNVLRISSRLIQQASDQPKRGLTKAHALIRWRPLYAF